jgi:hypothetical protein
MECIICTTRRLKKIAVCPFCEKAFCHPCAKTYILNETVNPKCPDCFKPWTRGLLFDLFGQSFMNKDYKRKREHDLFETEKALLPETLDHLLASSRRDLMEKLTPVLEKLTASLNKAINLINKHDENQQFSVYTDKLSQCFNLVQDLPKDIAVQKISHFKCTNIVSDEQCRGFVVKQTIVTNGKTVVGYVCGICHVKVCKNCREENTSLHICDENSVATVKLLKTDTKSCPTCFTPINKIDGCDQMWCPTCKTAFSWNTLEICSGKIHNPHYYEYMRTLGPLARDQGLDDTLDRLVHQLPRKTEEDQQITEFLHHMFHVSGNEIPRLATYTITANTYRPLRVKYLRGIINEKQFKRKIQQHDKLSSMNVEIGQILTTYVAAGTDILVSSVVHRDAKMTLQSTHSLIGFFNDVFCKLSRVYSMQTPNIDDKHYYIVDKMY